MSGWYVVHCGTSCLTTDYPEDLDHLEDVPCEVVAGPFEHKTDAQEWTNWNC